MLSLLQWMCFHGAGAGRKNSMTKTGPRRKKAVKNSPECPNTAFQMGRLQAIVSPYFEVIDV